MNVDVKIVDGAAVATVDGAVTTDGATAVGGGTVATIGADGEIVFVVTEAESSEVKPEPEVKDEPGRQFSGRN